MERNWLTRHIVVASLVICWTGGYGGAGTLKHLRESGNADVNGGNLHYEVYGKGAPLVFLHAGLADSRMWDGQVKYFSRDHTVVRFDVRGYGRSAPPIGPYVPVEDLSTLLQFLKIDRACIIGLSIGGTQAIDFAVAHRQAVVALVVVAGSPGWLPYSDQLNRRTVAIVTGAQKSDPASIVEGWLNDPMLAAARRQPRVEQEMRFFLGQNLQGILGLHFMRSPDVTLPNLSDIKVPTLVIVGDHDDPEIVERSRLMSREISGAKQVVVKGAGHMVNLEKPRIFNRELASFLRNLQ